ncbi:MAG: hypothetical protein LBT20_02875 [Clostridiales bacterium]|jgi:uncharacterized Zn finger protein (UPF0148 family)|nr:hypothetical protein [Clostridiales bacterium]
MSEEHSTAENNAVTYQCPACGGSLEFSPKDSSLKCPYCGNTVAVEKDTNIEERDLVLHASESEAWKDDASVYTCPNCGSSQVFEKGEISMKCPFCGTTTVMEANNLPGIKPDSLLPFSLSKADAEKIFQVWAKSRKFLPKAMKTAFNSESYKGIYLPVWTFDDSTTSSYDGKLGKHYTVTVGSGKNRRTETRTRYFHVSGTDSNFFDDVKVNGSDKISEKTLNKIEPFDTKSGVKYDKKFLAGFSAALYTKDLKTAWAEAKEKITAAIRKKILSKYDYDVVSYLNINTTHKDMTFKYMLFPVWISCFKFKDKVYNFFVNGTNGKITGKRPYSALKILAAVGIGIATVALIALIIWLLTK